ncbi:MAG: FAD-binding oxidoreductase, partial [Corynebacterium variabile]
MDTDTGVALPPMAFNLWGTVEEAKPLGDSPRKLLAKLMGVTGDDGTAARDVPVGQISLSPVGLAEGHLTALAGIVGASHLTTEDAQRAPRSRGKSSLDLLEWRAGAAGQEISAPDAVLAP